MRRKYVIVADDSILSKNFFEEIAKLEREWGAEEIEPCEDVISREAVIYYIKGHIHEIISESGVDKNAHTNRVLRMIINGIETMPSVGYKESEADDK